MLLGSEGVLEHDTIRVVRSTCSAWSCLAIFTHHSFRPPHARSCDADGDPAGCLQLPPRHPFPSQTRQRRLPRHRQPSLPNQRRRSQRMPNQPLSPGSLPLKRRLPPNPPIQG